MSGKYSEVLLVNGGRLHEQHVPDRLSVAALAVLGNHSLSDVAAIASANGALTAGVQNPVDATGGNKTMTLADAASAGLMISVSKKDSSANTVTVSVAHLRDGGSGSITLVGQYEALLLVSKADGSWWPVGDHKTKVYLDSVYKTPVDNLRTLADSTFTTGLNNAFAVSLTATAVKTSSYTAAVGDLIPVDATSGAVTITLPPAPADRTRIAVKKIDASTNVVTVSRGGSSDVFNKAGGSTSLTLALTNQALSLQYSGGIWYVVGDDLPLGQLDTRYNAAYAEKSIGALAPDFAAPTLTVGVTIAPLEIFGGYLWGITGTSLYRSSDDGVTWSSAIATLPGTPNRIIPTSDGEILVCTTANIYKSAGWTANPATATYSVKVTKSINTGAGILGWGFDGNGTKFIANEYSGADRSESRYVWISTDSGTTWAVKFDLRTIDAGSTSHWHGCCYDAWADRFFVSNGHGTSRGVYYSSDNGTTWTLLGGTLQPDGEPTVLVATDDGIVCGSDATEGGLYGIPRTTDPTKMQMRRTARWATNVDGDSGFAERGYRDSRTGLVYVSFKSDFANVGAAVAAGNARSGAFIWSDTPAVTRFPRVLITATGKAVGVLDRGASYDRLDADVLPRGAAYFDTGNIRAGVALYQSSVAVGPGTNTQNRNETLVGSQAKTTGAQDGTAVGFSAKADDRGVGLGSGAHADADDSSAIGYNAAAAGVNQTVVGSGASAAAASTAAVVIGYLAAGTVGTSITVVGAGATVNNNNGTAVGHQAATTTQGVAIGKSATSTSGSSAVAVGHSSTAAGTSTAIGQGATASGLQAVVVGQAGTATQSNSTALGWSADATAATAIAIGANTTASHSGGIALGTDALTTATKQVQIDDRHIEMKEQTAPTNPGADRGRLFLVDNGSGKTQLCVIFNTGSAIVLATQA